MLTKIRDAPKTDYFMMTDTPLRCPKCRRWVINGGICNTAKICPECGGDLLVWSSYGGDGSRLAKHD